MLLNVSIVSKVLQLTVNVLPVSVLTATSADPGSLRLAENRRTSDAGAKWYSLQESRTGWPL